MNENGKIKVLIVDDEKGLRIGTKRLLEMDGYEVDTAENGTEGITLGTTKEFDIAIIDLKMPDIGGLEVLKQIKKKFPDTICFIATAYPGFDTATESAKLGAFNYIPKPFTQEELLNNLRQGYEKRILLIENAKWKKQREESLLEVAFEKTRLNTIINSITEGILVINKYGQAVLYNPAALIYLQLPKIEIEESILSKLPDEIKSVTNKLLELNKYEEKSFSVQLKLKGENEIYVEATTSPVPHPDGSLAGVVIVLKNITESKKLELLKSQFVTMVAHELKAPIAAVYGYLKLFSDSTITLNEEQKLNYINRSQLRLDGLLKMVNDLLDISRMEMKTVQREILEINIVNVIQHIIELFQNEIKKKEINLIFNFSDNIPLLKADNDEITRLFTNLISNAIKYNKQNGKIVINIKLIDKYILLEIFDTGIGIKNEDQHKLFSEFYRAKNEFTKEISGTGLGLSIVKRIIDSYAGKIEFESEFQKGSKFFVYLPC